MCERFKRAQVNGSSPYARAGIVTGLCAVQRADEPAIKPLSSTATPLIRSYGRHAYGAAIVTSVVLVAAWIVESTKP